MTPEREAHIAGEFQRSKLSAAQLAVVREHIEKHPGREDILRTLRWDSLNRCFMCTWAGMVLGIEADGHIHS